MLQNSIVKRIADAKCDLKLGAIKVSFKMDKLAQKSGVPEDTLHNILKGTTKNPGIYTVAKIADALACSIDDLIKEDIENDQEEIKLELIRDCITKVIGLWLQHIQQTAQTTMSLIELLQIFTATYLHSLNKNLKTADIEFATDSYKMLLRQHNNTQNTLPHSSILKDNLANKISAMGPDLSRKMLALKAGTTQENLSLILSGKVKNPGVYIIAKIAKALNTSVDELIGRAPAVTTNHLTAADTRTKKDSILDSVELKAHLAANCAAAIIELLEKRKIQVNLDKFVHIFKNVYRYSFHNGAGGREYDARELCTKESDALDVKNHDTVDTHFVRWFVDYVSGDGK